MTPDERTGLADDLAHAYETRMPIDPPSQTTTLSVEDAYAVQSLQIERWVSSGARVRGHKIGLTSRVMQKMFGVGA